MKKDFVVVLVILFLFFGVGYWVVHKDNGVSYSLKEEENSASLVEMEENIDLALEELDTFSIHEKKECPYSLEEVYASIYQLKDSTIKSINRELVSIYVHFYDYFDEEVLFYNMNQEAYNYEEYMLVTKNHVMRQEEDVFAMYLTTYDKCQVFSMLAGDYGEKYCG